jgi:hypothetical protein
MQMQRPEIPDEITVFIVEGTHRLATIAINDYGFLQSAKMAQSYLERAIQVLDLNRHGDRAFMTEVSTLKTAASHIMQEYAQFEKFCGDCERFDLLDTHNWIEWISKWAVHAKSRAYLETVGYSLAYKIRTFHSRVCVLLTAT